MDTSVKHYTKEERVADYLREGIISGQFPRGSKLKQAEIAEMLGTSITPVREAIKLLGAEGYILGSSHRGAVVAPFDINATEEITDLRITLECKLGLKAIGRLSQSDINELQRMQDEFEAAAERGDTEAVRSINYRFHETIYSVADMPQTLKFVRTLWARYPFDLINKVSSRIDRASVEHRDMLQALIVRDEVALMNALRVHIRAGWDEFKASYTE